MRGKGFPYIITSTGSRITPAYAGKRLFQHPFSSLRRDHPRLCGEKSKVMYRTMPSEGSPPPMRGKVLGASVHSLRQGITPAYAGKSRFCMMQSTQCVDHPRLCGEKRFPATKRAGFQGSPPPMRGKDLQGSTAQRFARITPAYAGKRVKAKNLLGFHRDHPRLCGEKCFIYRL